MATVHKLLTNICENYQLLHNDKKGKPMINSNQFYFIAPLFDNEGHSLAPEIEHIEKVLIREFGGFIQTRCSGKWVNDEGVTMKDDSILYSIYTDNLEGKDNPQPLEQRILYFKKLLRQKAMFYSVDNNANSYIV